MVCADLSKINVCNREFIQYFITEARKITDLKGIAVFGSNVRDDCTEGSDIDIILFSDKTFEGDTYNKQIYDLRVSCATKKIVPLDLVCMRDITELLEGTSLFCETVRADGFVYFPFR